MTNTYKIILIGDGGVGKSVFLNRFVNNDFNKKYVPTLGVDVIPCKFGNTIYNIWDCAGQEKFSGLGDGYYIDSHAAIFMFDVTSELSFKNLGKWLRNVKRIVGDIPFIVVGTKCDLPRICSREKIEQILGYDRYIEISSKSGKNISEVFLKLSNIL